MNEQAWELLRLIIENPNLPVIPMVDGEVVVDDSFRYWLGAFGSCRVDEYLIDEWYGDGCVRFKSDNDDEIIIEGIAEQKYNGTDEDYKRAEEEIKTMWKKAIVVYIDQPY